MFRNAGRRAEAEAEASASPAPGRRATLAERLLSGTPGYAAWRRALDKAGPPAGGASADAGDPLPFTSGAMSEMKIGPHSDLRDLPPGAVY